MRILFLIACFYLTALSADPIRNEFSVDNGVLTYYLEQPTQALFPIVLAIEGSCGANPRSVLRLHQKLNSPFLNQGMALVTMERRGVDDTVIEEELFHAMNFPSQRLADHIQLINHLRQYPPKGWNNQLIILGGSEGGPIAIKLSDAVYPDACIVLVGCGDQTFKEYIWRHIQIQDPCEFLPGNREEYEAQITTMKNDPDPKKWWYGQTFRYWADALDQSEWQEFLRLRCPVLVIAGSEDLEVASTDRLIHKAEGLGQKVTYWRIDGMGHAALDPQWNMLEKTVDWTKEVVN